MLLDLIEGHRSAFEYDWRTRFHKPLTAIGTRAMPWGEAYRLTVILASDPSSRVGAALAGIAEPASRELVALSVLAGNHLALHTENRPKLRAVPDPLAKSTPPPEPRARLTTAQVDAIWLEMTREDVLPRSGERTVV